MHPKGQMTTLLQKLDAEIDKAVQTLALPSRTLGAMQMDVIVNRYLASLRLIRAQVEIKEHLVGERVMYIRPDGSIHDAVEVSLTAARDKALQELEKLL